MGRSKWLLLLLIPMLFGFDTRNPFRTRGPFKAYDFTIGGGSAGGCTDGVDCLCDTLSPTSTLLFCEDFESVALYENVEDGWPDGEDLGGTWNRGGDSYWENRFGNGDGGLFNSSDGAPTLGTACGFGGFGCTGQKEWCSSAQGSLAGVGADCWGPNSNTGARIDIQRSGDFDAEVTDLALTGGIGVTADILAGNQHLAQRLPAGDFAGKHGDIHLKTGGDGNPINGTTAVTEVGITMLLAYSSNIGTEPDNPIGLFGGTYQWKHDEWYNSNDAYGEHWNLGNVGCGDVSDFPYRPFMWISSQSACNTALAGATVSVGSADCSSAALRMCSTTAYDRATDFPFGTVHCHQAHISGLGSASMSLELKHDGVTVFKMDGFDAASALVNQQYRKILWNAYSNRNEDGDGTTNDTDEAMYRYEDNIVIVNGPPEPCSAIGF